MRDPDSYKEASASVAAVLLFVSERRFRAAAREHLYWLELKAPDLRAKYLNGTFDPGNEDATRLELARFQALRSQVWTSFAQMAIAALLSIIAAYVMGALDFCLPVYWGHALGFIGAFLIGWAAVFELGGPRLASWDGETLCELVHPRVFQGIFLPGAFATMLSVLL